jgi:fibronectin type 3 domain-containing protein
MCHCEAQPKQSRFGRAIVLLWFILILIGGCGVKKPPVPWETVLPKRIVDLETIPREGQLLLEWTSPKENTDKSPLINLIKFQILRSQGNLINGECRGCGEKFQVVHEMKVNSEEEIRGKRLSITFEDQEAGKVYVYQVISVNRRGYPSSPSNPATVYWDNPPQPPERIRGEPGDRRVDLYWEPAEGSTGYNVYRRGEDEIFSISPLNREPLITNHFTDLNVENEKKYFYSVRAVRRVVKTDVEGIGSQDLSVTPTDLIPPGSPQGLVAITLRDGIELNWRKNREPDLLGYYVYRRKPGEREFKRLNEIPSEKETYLDTKVELEQNYEYAVTAVDNSVRKNESPFSEEVKVKYVY